MKVAFINATKHSIDPVERAFNMDAKEIEYFHLLDSSLLPMLQEKGSLTPGIISRFSSLMNMAVDAGAQIIQLTCSAFNDVTSILQPLYDVKLLRSDEAMLNMALKYKRVGMISTVHDTPPVLSRYLEERGENIHIESRVTSEAFKALNQGNVEEHDQRIRELISELVGNVDVILLSQYSMAHVAEQVTTSVPILTAPSASAKMCLEYSVNHLT